MSTRIGSTVSPWRTLRIELSRVIEDGVYLNVDGSDDGHRTHAVHVPRSDFIAAVEAELGVIVVDRATLPTVVKSTDSMGRTILEARGATLDGGGWATGSDALGWLALAEYLDAHPPVPPVDEAQVEVLVVALKDEGWSVELSDPLARRLVAAGWVKSNG